MSAPIGNQFWKLRSKHGRDTLFEDADKLKEAIEEYFQYQIDHPIMKFEQTRTNRPPIKNTDGSETWPDPLIGLPTARPFTMVGLQLYLQCSQPYFSQFKHSLREKIKPYEPSDNEKETPEQAEIRVKKAEDFLNVITWAENTIYNQKFEGAAAGIYNANIIARDLGLREGVDNKVTGNIHLSKEPTVFE